MLEAAAEVEVRVAQELVRVLASHPDLSAPEEVVVAVRQGEVAEVVLQVEVKGKVVKVVLAAV